MPRPSAGLRYPRQDFQPIREGVFVLDFEGKLKALPQGLLGGVQLAQAPVGGAHRSQRDGADRPVATGLGQGEAFFRPRQRASGVVEIRSSQLSADMEYTWASKSSVAAIACWSDSRENGQLLPGATRCSRQ